jgi:hypothetical protein
MTLPFYDPSEEPLTVSQLSHKASGLLESLACLERVTEHVSGVVGRVLETLKETGLASSS